MEMLQLKYFFESAENESFTKTAEKYIVPATSVSASVKRLEKELGCSLFDRSSNSIKLNTNGKRFMKSLYIVFDELNQAAEELSSVNRDNREINILVRAMRDDITDWIIEFSKKYPYIVFKTTFDFNEKDFEKYDIIIDEKNDIHKNFESFELYKMKLRLAANPKNSLCKKRMTLKKLKSEAFISWGEESNTHKILVSACKRAGFVPNITVISDDLKCNEKLIESGIGIGIVRENSQQIGKGRIKVIDVSGFDEEYTICSYYKRQTAYGNVKLFLNFLRNKTTQK